MLKLCNFNIERREEIHKRLKQFASRLRKRFAIKGIYLYGSFASGDIHEGSDIDLIIVGEFRGKMFGRIIEVTRLTALPIEPLVYTPEEFRKLRQSSAFLKQAIKASVQL